MCFDFGCDPRVVPQKFTTKKLYLLAYPYFHVLDLAYPRTNLYWSEKFQNW